MFLLRFRQGDVRPKPSLADLFGELLNYCSSVCILGVQAHIYFKSAVCGIVKPLYYIFTFAEALQIFNIGILKARYCAAEITFNTAVSYGFRDIFGKEIHIGKRYGSVSEHFGYRKH